MNKVIIKYGTIVLLLAILAGLYFMGPKELSEDKTSIFTTVNKTDINQEAVLYVHVCGAVVNPGVYEFSDKDRVIDAINKAGGMTDVADTSYLNMAKLLTDGMKLYVPTKEEASSMASGESTVVNINTASVQQLMTLPGIGQSKAEDIVNYRKANGEFKKIEDIMNISGIKEAAFNKIKDYISV